MAKEICISTTPHETRLAILEDDQLAEIYYERENEYTLAGSVYKGRVTRVLPGMQSSFVDVGLERDAFLYVTDFLEEQEDSEEYETSGGNGGGNGSARRGGERQAAEEAPAGEERRPRRDGRRGAGRGGDRSTEGRAEARPEAADAAPARPRASEERAAATAALRAAQPGETDREEKGEEESPQGTRRWRGRRGRRRGGVRAGVLGTTQASADGEVPAGELPQTAPFALPEHGAPGGLAAPLHIAEQDEEEPETLDLQASAAAPRREPLRGEEAGRRREGRAGRGGRGGRAGEERAAQSEQPDRPGRGRGEAAAPAGGSIVLPGESLSKYGASPAAEAAPKPEGKPALPSRPVNYTPPRPANQIEVIPGMENWDGGSVLPGETLSRYTGQPAPGAAVHGRAEPVLEAADEPADESAELVRAAMVHADLTAPETVAEALPGVVHGEQATTTAEPLDRAEQTGHAVRESEGGWSGQEGAAGGQAKGSAESADSAAGPEAAEYEPEDGAAAARLSPPNRNELRLSRLFGGGDSPAPAAGNEEKGKAAHEAGSAAPAAPEADFATMAAEATAETVDREHAPGHGDPAVAAAGSDEGLRSTLQAGSEGIPEMNPELGAGAHGSSGSIESSGYGGMGEGGFEETEGGLPQEAVSLHGVGTAYRGEDGFTDLVDQLQGFAPGSGLLEEETIDEDEYDFDPIDAHAEEHDLEELEEETLDGEAHHGAKRDEDGGREEHEGRSLRMESEDDDEDDAAAFALEEVEDEEDEGEPMVVGEPRGGEQNGERGRERPGEDRSRRGRGGDRGADRNARRRGGPGRRQTAQTQDLPIISDLLKQGQEILVQIAKEPIAKKGARITSHIALPGRFLVFMPTVSHVGVSRKISSDEERQRLKRILTHERGESAGGFIVRTAAEGASEEELRADLRFLISLWTEIKQRADTAKAPSLLYHDLNLVERILRDQVSSNFSTIWVDTEQEYERIVRFLNRFQPSLVRRVKLYTKETPLFEHFGIQEEISKALKSKVWLKSGGSIVINQTEALVAIDINTGKYVGKTARLEDTIVKTNLDAIPEIVRQIRLRDLGGIIVIDFIDMDERKNRHRVLAALEEAMKVDRAPSKVLQFNDFGLVAITRKRVKQSLERTLSVTCETCAGTGMVKSPVTVCNEIFIELRKMQKHLDGKDVMLRVNPEVVKQLKSGSGRWINEYEEIVGKTVIIKSDPSLHPEQFDIH